MRASWTQLKKVGVLKLRDTTLQNVNLIQEVTNKQQVLAEELKLDLSNQLKTSISDAMMMLQYNEGTPPPLTGTIESITSTTPSINSATSTITMDTLLTTIQDLKKEITSLISSKLPTPTNKYINPRTDKPWRRYCWTHGCCTHGSKDYENKSQNHKDDATFKNRQGGSNKNFLVSG